MLNNKSTSNVMFFHPGRNLYAMRRTRRRSPGKKGSKVLFLNFQVEISKLISETRDRISEQITQTSSMKVSLQLKIHFWVVDTYQTDRIFIHFFKNLGSRQVVSFTQKYVAVLENWKKLKILKRKQFHWWPGIK